MTDKFIADLTAHDSSISGTVTISIASPAVVSWTGHPLAVGQPLTLATTGALPTGLVAGTTYYVISAGFGANSFELSASSGGAAINTSGTQSGTHTAQGLPADDTLVEVQRSASSTATEKAPLSSLIKAYAKSWLNSAAVGLGNVANSLQLIAANNLSDLTDAGAARGNLGPSFVGYDPDYNDANIYLTTPSSSYAAGVMVAQRLVMLPIWVPRTRTFTTYGLVLTAGAGTSLITVGLYNANSALQPTTKIDQCATTVNAATGATAQRYTIAFGANQTLKPGLYFLAIYSDGAPSVIRLGASNGWSMGAVFSSTSIVPNMAKYRDTVTLSAGALPADESAQTYTTMATGGQSAPIVGIR